MKSELKRVPHPDPAVELFINIDPEPRVAFESFHQQLPQPLHPKAEAVIALHEVSLGVRSLEEALQIAESAYHQSSNVDLHLLLLILWIRALVFSDRRWNTAGVLVSRLNDLVSETTPAELQAWATHTLATQHFLMGNWVEAEKYFSILPGTLTPESPHYRRLMLLRAITYFQLGMGVIVEPTLGRWTEEMGPVYEARIAVSRFVNAVMLGALDTALEFLANEEQYSHIVLAPTRLPYENARYALRLICELNGRDFDYHAKHNSPHLGSEEPSWVQSTRCLMQRDIDGALRYARSYTATDKVEKRFATGIDAYCLLRAELCAGHGEAAQRLLKKHREAGCVHYLDDLFLARTQLLLGNTVQAGLCFARLIEAIEKYQAHGRLDFELRLACELSPLSLFSLTREAQQLLSSSKPPSASVSTSIKAESEKKTGIARLLSIDPDMRAVLDLVAKFADLAIPVLITGETGTGKELIAQALHEASSRAKQPFIAINCAAISDTLIESELFGHKRGAFTGAQVTQKGLFMEAANGTIFLDEIGEISPRLQSALLRVLETGEVRPVGSTSKHQVKCRVIAATNADLSQLVSEGRFRKDLFFRLQRLRIQVPALRERPDDIILLAQNFLDQGRVANQKASMTSHLEQRLRKHPWPGNVRELRNVIERMRILNSDKLLYDDSDLLLLHTATEGPQHQEPPDTPPLAEPRTDQIPTKVGLPIEDKQNITELIRTGKTGLRRIERLRELFQQFEHLKAHEVAEILGVSRVTAGRYLSTLCEEGFIERVTPTASPRSNYYRRIS